MKRLLNRIKKNKDNKGFTLLEIIVAIMILSIVSIPLIHTFVTSAKVNQKAKRVQDATDVAQSVAEYFTNTDMSTLLNMAGLDEDDLAGGSTINFTNLTDWRSAGSSTYFMGANDEQFTVDVSMTPRGEDSSSGSYGVYSYTVPELKDLYGDDAVTVMKQIYKDDSKASASATKKTEIDINIDEDGDYKYTVKVSYDGTSYSGAITFGSGTITDDAEAFPAIFLMYKVYDEISLSDKIDINITYEDSDYNNKRMVNLFFIQQEVIDAASGASVTLPVNNIQVYNYRAGDSSGPTSSGSIDNFTAEKNAASTDMNIRINTTSNLSGNSAITSDGNRKVKIYDITVNVKLDGDLLTSVDTVREELVNE